jgi:hypothetical protein
MLFLFGPALDRSDEPEEVSARLGRVNDIETFDTVAAKVRGASGAELLFLASHAVGEGEAVDPRFVLEFEKATLAFPGGMAPITAVFEDGGRAEYPSPDATSQVAKLWRCLEAVDGLGNLPCGLETARPHAAFVQALEESGAVPHRFSEDVERVRETHGGRLHWVEGLAEAFLRAYQTGGWPDLPGAVP